jgi:predicted amidohydrolase
VRIALVQMGARPNLAKATKLIGVAARKGARITCPQELFRNAAAI